MCSSHLTFVMSLLIFLTACAVTSNAHTEKLADVEDFPIFRNIISKFLPYSKGKFALMGVKPLLYIIQNSDSLDFHAERASPHISQYWFSFSLVILLCIQAVCSLGLLVLPSDLVWWEYPLHLLSSLHLQNIQICQQDEVRGALFSVAYLL